MRLAYLITEYPKVSHTFIRREIREIERQGHSVLRLAIRKGNAAVVDPLDRQEQAKTLHCLAQPMWRILLEQLRMMVSQPKRYFSGLRLALRMGWRSERGVLRHLAYLCEAVYLSRVLRRNSIQHVHAHFGTNATAVARLGKRLGGPDYSFTVHGIDLFDAPRSLDIAGKVADAAFVVGVCDFATAQLRRWADVEHWPKIHVIRCALPKEFSDAPESPNVSSNIFVCVARLSPEKGHVLLIDALAELVRAGEDVRLVLVGDGILRASLECRIREAGLADRVEITGYVGENEVRQCILAARALVLPSFAEGLPMVIMEAFALRRPVISTYVAGIPELVRPGENGWLVPPGNVQKLATAMHAALRTSKEQLDEMGAAGCRRVRDLHDLKSEVTNLVDLFAAHVPEDGLPVAVTGPGTGCIGGADVR